MSPYFSHISLHHQSLLLLSSCLPFHCWRRLPCCHMPLEMLSDFLHSPMAALASVPRHCPPALGKVGEEGRILQGCCKTTSMRNKAHRARVLSQRTSSPLASEILYWSRSCFTVAQLPLTPGINALLNGMLWPTFYVYYVSSADNEQRNLDILSLTRQYFSLPPSLGCYMAFLNQAVFSLIYVKCWTFCKYCHLKNYQGALFDGFFFFFQFENAHEFANRSANWKPSHRATLPTAQLLQPSIGAGMPQLSALEVLYSFWLSICSPDRAHIHTHATQ